jgi:hypothetical protein
MIKRKIVLTPEQAILIIWKKVKEGENDIKKICEASIYGKDVEFWHNVYKKLYIDTEHYEG